MSSLLDRPNGPQTIAASSSSQAGLNAQASIAPLQPATLVLVATAEAVVPHPQNAAIAFILSLSPNQGLEQTIWDLAASGFITTKNSTNITCKLYSGTSLTVGSNTALGASSAQAVNTTTCPWYCKGTFIYDSVSGKLTGSVKFFINNVLTAEAAISNVITGISDVANPVCNFVLTFTSSAADATHQTTVSVKKFSCG